MLNMVKRFPSHATNGFEHPRTVKNAKTGQMEQVSEPSFFVLVPEGKQSLTASSRIARS